MILQPVVDSDKRPLGYMINCPGCEFEHVIHVSPRSNSLGASWSFDGNMDAPTFSPSVRVRWSFGPKHEPRVCHFFVRAGKIEFCGDCTHSLAGQTVDMIPIED